MCVCVCVCVTVHGGVRVSVRAGPLSLMFEKANRVAQLVSSLKHTHTHTHTLKHTGDICFFSLSQSCFIIIVL